eukprot:2523767-Rhodomonas_salina.2
MTANGAPLPTASSTASSENSTLPLRAVLTVLPILCAAVVKVGGPTRSGTAAASSLSVVLAALM